MKRDWSAALEKRDAKGNRCLVCRTSLRVEMAHVTGRVADRRPPLQWPEERAWREPYLVVPSRIVLLCGPATDTTTCHGKHDAGLLDLLPRLTLDEVLQAVADSAAGRENGLEKARIRLAPSAYRTAVAA